MSQPLCTPHTTCHVRNSGICASDLVFQTAAIILNEKGEVLMVQDSVAGILSLPRSDAPHSLDTLLEAPLGFLIELGCDVDPMPLCKPYRRFKEGPHTWLDDRRPDLKFGEQTTTAPFAIALDVAYLPFSNMARIADVRQSVVWWYAGTTHSKLCKVPAEKKGLVHFLSMYDAEYIMLNQQLYDSVGVDALRLFQEAWEATKALPPRITELHPLAPKIPWKRHPGDVPCYPEVVMRDPIAPVWTSNTTAIEPNGFWPHLDLLVRTGAIVIDPLRELVLLASTPEGSDTVPRGPSDGDDVRALLLNPLACAGVPCTRLDLPRLGKRYSWVEGREQPEAETDVLEETTTDPFMISLQTHWVVRGRTRSKSRGFQALTYWYGGTFDATAAPERVAVQVTEALARLKSAKDWHAVSALNMFAEMYQARKDDIRLRVASDASSSS